MVLGMRSSEVGCTDFRLILDLKRVLIKVDFPKPLCPGERTGANQQGLLPQHPSAGAPGQEEGLGCPGGGLVPMVGAS